MFVIQSQVSEEFKKEVITSRKSRKVFMEEVTCKLDIQDYTARLETKKGGQCW